MNTGSECVFENVVSKIFENAGYSVNQDGQLQHQLEYADIIAEKENRRYCIEVKYFQYAKELWIEFAR